MKSMAELGWFEPIPPQTWWRRALKAIRRGWHLIRQPFLRPPF